MTLSGPDNGEMDFLARFALDAIDDGIVVIDADLKILLANDVMKRLHPAKLPYTGQRCYAVFHGRQEPCSGCPYRTALETGEPQSLIFEFTFDENLTRSYEISMHRLTDAQGDAVGVVEHIREVTQRKRAEQRLRDELTRRRLMVENSPDGILILDQDGSVYEANEQFARMLGYRLEEVYHLRVFDWEVAHPKDAVLQMLAAVDESGDHFETRHMRQDGTFVEVEISSNGAFYNGRKLIFCVCRDITEKKAMERQIRDLAVRDCLTDVYNRRYIFERLSEMMAEYSRGGDGFCVSILDLDHFKMINDIHGHQAGDFALEQFAQTVAPLIRPYDLLGRYGGEEFIVVSRRAGAWQTAAMVERIMDIVRRKAFVYDGREMRFTFSCGLADSAEFSRGNLTIEGLIGLADKRLYEAKAAGRDRCMGPGEQLPDALAAGQAALPPVTH
ncbi:MAG: diguanylate cyclase [Thermoleophilia bacterium]|nr:diguanylate cyclase [Thermoleophilia bacterium]